MENVMYAALFTPLIGFLVLMTFSSVINRTLTGIIGCLTIFLSFICFSWLLYIYNQTDMNPFTATLYQWFSVQGIEANFTLRLDPLSLLMTMIITGVGFLIHIYSVGYMEHEEDFARYFACMNFFVFAMLLLVLAGNILLLFVGWEGVGLASYLLIGYYYHRPAAAQAATKAFVINRIGDLGLLLGLLLTFHLFGTGEISEISKLANEKFSVGAPIMTLLTLLYFIGAVGKSAQLPLYTWLPDAMEGPTPVSALIHAATMVTAGVYLVVRMHPVFMLAPTTLNVIGDIGAVTALFAALCALGQIDLKRVLAFSTVSQLGLMFLACGIGAFYAAMFHLTMHAFIKALLFLSAGNVVHMMNGCTNMEKMGGLAKILTKTHWLFLIGLLALSGFPPLSAFFSKDLILEQEYLSGYELLYGIGLASSILTGVYLTRAYCLTFWGKSHLDEKILKSAKEVRSIMLNPLYILAILSIGGGFLGFAFGKTPLLEGFLAEVGITLSEHEPPGTSFLTPEVILAMIGSVAGIAITGFVYLYYVDRLKPTLPFLTKAYYVNEIYWTCIAVPIMKFAKLVSEFFEPEIFDGLIRFTVYGTQKFAGWLQKMQSGQIRSYVAWMVFGTVFLIVYLVF